MNVVRLIAVSLGILLPATLIAGPRDTAYKIFNRINGVPPTSQELDEMEDIVASGDLKAAAMKAMESDFFYNLSLKRFANPWTNVDLSPRVPLTDYVATVIGVVRDDLSFDQLLYEDIIYVGSDALVANPNSAIPAYSVDNNDHYVALEENRINLKDNLVRKTQTEVSGIGAPAGVITTRAFGEAYFQDGTNRRPTRFLLMTYLCRDMEQVHDTTRSDFRIRQDIPRSPGGDSNMFRNNCAGCHTGMDPLSGAFAYYDFIDDSLQYNAGVVADKMNRNNDVFPMGYETVDDSWMNNWTEGPNSAIGWSGETSGNGAASMGRALATSDGFNVCMSEKVFEHVCLRKPESGVDKDIVKANSDNFANGKNMKSLFADTAASCLNDE